MAYHMGEAPLSARNSFTAFYNAVRDMKQSLLVKNLDQDHYLFRAIEDFQKTVVAVAKETNWRGPSSINGYPDYGYNPRSSYDGSRDGRSTHRPTTPNLNPGGGLHPNMFEQTPPRTPSNDRASNRSSGQYSDVSALSAKISVYEKKFEKWQDELRSLKQENQDAKMALDDSQQSLASVNKIVLEQNTKIATIRKTIEELHSEAADLYHQSANYEDAARHLEKLAVLKLDESKALDIAGNMKGASNTMNQSLVYEGQMGQMLKLNRQYSEAEKVFKGILKKRKEIYGSEHLTRYKESRGTQLQLCLALRKQRLDHKTQEAEDLYRKHAILTRLEEKSDSSREWAFNNAVGLAGALIERRDYRHGILQLQDVWDSRSKVSSNYARRLDSEVLDVIGTLERRSEAKPLIEALKIICCDKPRLVAAHILPCYAKLGKLLHEDGNNAGALAYLEATLDNRDRLNEEDRQTAIWALALVQASRDRWDDVKTCLDDLKKFDNAQGEPSPDMISALKARMQLNAGQFIDAEATATALWDNYGVQNILHPSSGLHQADTLLKAMSKQKRKEKYTEARTVWTRVYDGARKGDLSKKEMRIFAATGRMLADDWEKSRQGKTNNLTSPAKIRSECREMETLATATATATAN